ncbi:hypothetical protein EA462_11870 [Natrarchaeobius halalkaliphilus]|uniref:Uncharacterized protein n=1 Tax=Natrarchaeobius halalkaliphilus TaxID=1679091 RepID=A0A3N6NWV6_9EURY|nr:DUF6276 family protein [Natrarchaeobius halalkaliphilus]RQG89069.1 hypothetical protein EA462_11870 [Natrarchaeobius halalkaliphilus]
MTCTTCGARTISFSVPPAFLEYAPDGASMVTFCTHCLALESEDTTSVDSETGVDVESEEDEIPAFGRVSDSFPTDPDQAIPLALTIGHCSSLATNREAIESLLRDVERAGTDPLLALERLTDDPTVDPAIDLERRAHQLEQLLY